MASNLATYVYAKPKSTGDDQNTVCDMMNIKQKRETLKHYDNVLEIEQTEAEINAVS